MKYIYSIFIIFFLVFTSCKSTGYLYSEKTSDWHLMAVVDGMETYVDTASIRKDEVRAFAFEKRIYTTQESKTKRIEPIAKAWEKMGKAEKVRKWDDFSYEIFYTEYDCLNNRYRVLSVEDFDSQGNTIVKTHGRKAEWKTLTKESIGDHTLFFICDFEE